MAFVTGYGTHVSVTGEGFYWLFDLQLQYLNNKIYNNDVRFLFKLNYWFNTNI